MKNWLNGVFGLVLSACVVVSAHASDPHSWKQYLGCYETVAWNGRPVNQPGSVESSTVELGTAMLVRDLNGAEIPSFNFKIYQKMNGSQPEYDYQVAFVDRGQFTEDQDASRYFFEGQLMYPEENRFVFTMKQRVVITRKGADLIEVHAVRNIPELGGEFDCNVTYLLKKKTCSR